MSASDIAKPHFNLFPLLKQVPLCFKSINSCSNQFRFYFVKANIIHQHCCNYRTYTQLMFPCTLFWTQASFLRLKAVDLVTLFFSSLYQHFNWSHTSKVMPLVSHIAFFPFLTHTFFTCHEPSWVGIKYWCNFKSCVHYIFASLSFMSKREHLWNKKECFLFHLKSSFHSWDDQILNFQIFKCHDVIKCLSMKHETHFTE